MYDRFTDRARMAMQHANEEALRFGHDFIDGQHVLLGLVQVKGVAFNVLKNLDINVGKMCLEVERMAKAGAAGAVPPQVPRAKRLLEFAIEEARNLNHNYLGTEHLLLGLLADKEGVAAQVLTKFGVRLEEVRDEIVKFLGDCSTSNGA